MSKRTPEQNRYYEFGSYVAAGAIDRLGMCLFWLFIVVEVINVLLRIILPTDDSDAGRFHRSGVEIVTDSKTGRQYLVTHDGGIVPRDGAK